MTSTAQPDDIKQVICVKWGTGYGPEYVNRLYGMVRRNVTGRLRFICLTDDCKGLRREVECMDLPELGVPHPQNTIGKWKKVVLWGRDVHGLSGPTLYIDLDSVVVGNLDGYFSYGKPDDVILARNWTKPLQRLGQTSVFRFPIGKNGHILDNFRANPQGIADRFRFEQHYITSSVPGGIKLWPERWTKHFRLHCLPVFPLRFFKVPRVPRGTKIVTFPGGPNPDDIELGRWTREAPAHRSPWEHIKAAFGPNRLHKRRWEHLRRFVLPCPWISENWRE